MEEGADQDSPSRESEQWGVLGNEVGVALTNFDESNTGSEFQLRRGDHTGSVLSSDDSTAPGNLIIKDGSEKAIPTLPREDDRALAMDSIIQQAVKAGQGQGESVATMEPSLEQEYIESGIQEYLAQGDTTARTGNVGRRAREGKENCRTKPPARGKRMVTGFSEF